MIKHARVVDPSQRLDEGRDILLVDGKVAKLAERITDPGAEVLDATGLIATPGFIDAHVHLREPGYASEVAAWRNVGEEPLWFARAGWFPAPTSSVVCPTIWQADVKQRLL